MSAPDNVAPPRKKLPSFTRIRRQPSPPPDRTPTAPPSASSSSRDVNQGGSTHQSSASGAPATTSTATTLPPRDTSHVPPPTSSLPPWRRPRPWRRTGDRVPSLVRTWRTYEPRLPESQPSRDAASATARDGAPHLLSGLLRVNQFGLVPEVTAPRDAKAAAASFFTTKVITTPNQDWVPEHPIERSIIRTYSNGLWGYNEYSRWPQPLTDNMWHVACIPQGGSVELLPEVAWLSLDPARDWVADQACSVKGVGYLTLAIRENLAQCAAQAILAFDNTMGGPEHHRVYGQELRTVLRQCVDTMNRLPGTPVVAVALGAHIQRISLELVGLRTYLREVLPRILSGSDHSRLVLPVVGTFVHDENQALRWARAGVPTWLLQPLTEDLKVWTVVVAERPSFLRDGESNSRLEYDPDELSGVVNTKGGWLSRMVFAVSKQLCSATLAPLTDSGTLVSKTIAMPEAPAPSRGARSTQPKKTRRSGKKSKAEAGAHPTATGSVPRAGAQASARVSCGAGDRTATATNVAVPPPTRQPSREYTPSPFYTIPHVWASVLQEVGSLPAPAQSVTYFYPPPFLLDTVVSAADVPVPPITDAEARLDAKVHQYLHNLVRIRSFCRLRLLDPTISGRPMTILEWRAALWGDYQVHVPPAVERTAAQQRVVEKRYGAKNVVSRLCAQSAALRSYDIHEVPSLGDMAVSRDRAACDIRVRLCLLWEAHEINFRCELMALDALMVPRTDWPIVQRWGRESQLSGVWGIPSSLVTVLPDTLAEMVRPWWIEAEEEQWNRGERSVRAFLDMMARWPDVPDELLAFSLKLVWNKEDYEQAQVQTVRFYTRCFIAKYHRLPIPPMFYPPYMPVIRPSRPAERDSQCILA